MTCHLCQRSTYIYVGSDPETLPWPTLIMLSAVPRNISVWLASIHSHVRGQPEGSSRGEVTGYWRFACSVSCTAKVNRWASRLFTPLPAPDRESHGTESGRRHGQWFGLLTVREGVLISLRWPIKLDISVTIHKVILLECGRRGSFWRGEGWNWRSRVALFTFLRIVPLNISHMTPQINFTRDEVGKNSWNSNISLMYIPIGLTSR